MKKHVLFIQGGAGDEDHAADAKLVDSLRKNLGDKYIVQYPSLRNESTPDFGRMKQIKKEISSVDGEIILAGHSLGASMLMKYLSETPIEKKIEGLFLIATPFWSGDEDWVQGLKLQENFTETIPDEIPIFLYHARDDEEVPFDHLGIYARHLPKATVREIVKGGHQFNNDLSFVAKDIQSLGTAD